MVDASDNGIGVVLQQLEHGVWKALSFFSRKLTDAQKRYSTYYRELLAAYRSKLDNATPRQQRHLEYIAQFTVNVQHIPGKDNNIADSLSRIDELHLQPAIDYDGNNVNVSIDRLKPCFSDNSPESDIESSIGEDTPNKPAQMPEKKFRDLLHCPFLLQPE
ncbi:retrovirus-related Pol polyprotein from transposon opus-like Protein [Trichonephila clavipes]|nr:retrovirus-related Pol polyprotein from transposon opus-like Protein [Trichonephila clavipes]